jgi:MFS family permease
MVQALVLAFLVLKETVQIWHIVSLSIFIGIINAFDIPVRQSFTVDMVEGREELANAIALNSSMVNGARLLGPSIAGILIAATDEGGCFLINGISYIPVIAALMAMRFSHGKIKPKNKRIMHELKEGFSYAFGFPLSGLFYYCLHW